jgi:hypothetical protein
MESSQRQEMARETSQHKNAESGKFGGASEPGQQGLLSDNSSTLRHARLPGPPCDRAARRRANKLRPPG